MPSLRVMTYNIHGARNRSALRTVVDSVDPDLLVVNESPQLPLWWRVACPALASSWRLEHVAGGRNAGRNMICAGEYVGVSRVHVRRIKQPRTRDPIRGVVSAQLRIDGHPFGVVGCHLSLSPAARERDVEVVVEAADDLEGPVILAGDLNEEPGGPSWKRLGEAQFRTADDDTLTFPASGPTMRVDVLMVRGEDVEITEHRVPAVPAPLLSRASDHLPVQASITWRS